MKEHVRRAADVIAGTFGKPGVVGFPSTFAVALDAAGLLVTPEAEACVKACEDIHTKCYVISSPTVECAAQAGRASLDAKKPKPRWVYERCGDLPGVRDTHGPLCGTFAPYPTEAHARAVVKALNEVEG